MATFKIKWSFINSKTATQAINLFGAKSFDSIKLYANNKMVEKLNYCWTDTISADKRAIKEIKKFFKFNQGINDFVEFNKQ